MNARYELIKEFTLRAVRHAGGCGENLEDVTFSTRESLRKICGELPTKKEVQKALQSLKKEGLVLCGKVRVYVDMTGNPNGHYRIESLWTAVR